MVLASPTLRALYEREQRKRHRLAERNSELMHSAGTPNLQGLSVCECYEQNGERK